ncbi:hypothetical protein F4804DRAFT_244519 [Jackrogersella minutella]|nr:hypothetical protein F4804DRAFT_244519 [Jackrogersella minutella]
MEHVSNGVSLVELKKRSLIPQKWEGQYILDTDDMVGYDDETKWRLHVDIFNYIVAAHCYRGIVTTIGPDYEGVALCGMWRLYYQLSAEGRKRYYQELLPVLHNTMVETMGDRANECYYLVYLGTKPSGQRRGYARKLIEQMAAKADSEGRPMYLESSSEKNTGYYKKFGFEAKKDIFLGADSRSPVRLTIMVREPQKLPNSIPIKLNAGFKMM